MNNNDIKITKGDNEYTLKRDCVASINPKLCINCGTCRLVCPTEAISENQRLICRQCPDCGSSKVFFHKDAGEYAHEHACSISCPLGTIPEGYVNLIAEGRLQEARKLIDAQNPLPQICSKICSAPCEDECKRGSLLDKPIAIRALKRYVVENTSGKIPHYVNKYDAKIAVAGAGPAGLIAAHDLALKGYKVTIFESSAKPGGMMQKCIPDFRLDKDELQNEINTMLGDSIHIEYNANVGKNPTIKQLFDDGFAAVLIAAGAQKGVKLSIDGNFGEQVYDAVNLMERINSNEAVPVGENAVVIGGGSVAMDTARTLRRLGAKTVHCCCIEDGEMIPAPKNELEDAKSEGISLITAVSPVEIKTDWISVKGVKFRKVESIGTDNKGKLNIKTTKNSDFELQADTVVFAVGQKTDINALLNNNDFELSENGRITYDSNTMMTSIDKVFAAGDVVEVRGSVTAAMASGRKAALGIDNMLQGRHLSSRVEHKLTTAPVKEMIYPVRLENLAPQKLPRRKELDFEEVEKVFTKKQAVLEARRCMKCGYETVDAGRCIGCGICAENCVESAITMVCAEKEA